MCVVAVFVHTCLRACLSACSWIDLSLSLGVVFKTDNSISTPLLPPLYTIALLTVLRLNPHLLTMRYGTILKWDDATAAPDGFDYTRM